MTRFCVRRHGFAFRGCLVRTTVTLPAGVRLEVRGRCCGLASAALDYFYSGLGLPDGPPSPEPWLTDYLAGRHRQSLALPSTARFALWAMAGDESIANATWGYEIPRLCRALDNGYPVILGLLSARHLSEALVRSRQVVAYGYEMDADGRGLRIQVYDAETPGEEVELTVGKSAPLVSASNEDRPWRGFFVHDYRFERPPVGPADEARAAGSAASAASVNAGSVLELPAAAVA